MLLIFSKNTHFAPLFYIFLIFYSKIHYQKNQPLSLIFLSDFSIYSITIITETFAHVYIYIYNTMWYVNLRQDMR